MNSNGWLFDSDLPHGVYEEFRKAAEIAWDIETSGLDFRNDSIGTVQLHSPRVGSAIVKLDDNDVPRNLRLLLSDQQVRKVLHHAPFDLRFMLAQWSCWPQNVACTKIASKVASPHSEPGDHSLKPLLRKHLGVEIDKSMQVSDWTGSNLSDEQIEYAFNDVRFLLDLFGALSKIIDETGRSDLYARCLEFLPTRTAMDVGGWPDVFLY